MNKGQNAENSGKIDCADDDLRQTHRSHRQRKREWRGIGRISVADRLDIGDGVHLAFELDRIIGGGSDFPHLSRDIEIQRVKGKAARPPPYSDIAEKHQCRDSQNKQREGDYQG
ncbi:hypothetical protein [Paracoccus sp. (in: a-proteobacteria)]|uniref:hypothetical protein n=1 Tax=Paracoccus sp. TaxID=267 RepID=UPI002B003860|nr:hypothetical protein [Paracoccus sp. (in: a-proteobacteria)]